MSKESHTPGVPARRIRLSSPPTIVPNWPQRFQVYRPVSQCLGQKSGQKAGPAQPRRRRDLLRSMCAHVMTTRGLVHDPSRKGDHRCPWPYETGDGPVGLDWVSRISASKVWTRVRTGRGVVRALAGRLPHYPSVQTKARAAGPVLDCCSKALFGLGLAFSLRRWSRGLATGDGTPGALYLFSVLGVGTTS
jgi:hypothetical protein